jgi:rfaE bifunctional protein nucleotidyltransferase chain/domain
MPNSHARAVPDAGPDLRLAPPSPASPNPATEAQPKILSGEQLAAARAEAREQGRRVVQCHGCFDIVHPGHIRHLRHAKTNGDVLLVSITSDAGVGKGTGRPLIPQELRAENLAALDFVDWVHVHDAPTAEDLLERVRPDVYVKGREYEFNDDPRFRAEREAVERHGGKVVFTSGDVVFSSSALIAAMEHSTDPYHARLEQLLAREELSAPALTDVIAGFRGRRVLVVGEVLVDIYVLCDRPEVAEESPVLTLRPVETRRYDGGAAVIARHLAAMGARPVLVTGMSANHGADEVRARLAADGVEVRWVQTDSALPEKQQFLAGGQKVMKVDLLERCRLDASRQDELLALASESAGGSDAAIVADYGGGLLSPRVLARLCPTLRGRVGVVTAGLSGRRANLRLLRHMDLVVPSERDLRDAMGMQDEGLPTLVWRLMQETGGRAAMVTLGAEGVIAFDRLADADGPGDAWRSRVRAEHVPGLCAHAVDALGCDDALLAAATLAMCAGGAGSGAGAGARAAGGGGGLLSAAFLGSIAAAAQAGRLGNTVVSGADLRQGVARVHASHLTFSPEQAGVRRALGRAGAGGAGGGFGARAS